MQIIREGEYGKKEVNIIYEEMSMALKQAEEKSVLPYKPNYNKVWEIYQIIIVDALEGNDARYVQFVNKSK